MSKSTASFIDIPVELRLQIYLILLHDFKLAAWAGYGAPVSIFSSRPMETDPFSAITFVCRKIRGETLPLLLESMPHNFYCLSTLGEWISEGKAINPSLLNHVADVSLYVKGYGQMDLMEVKNDLARVVGNAGDFDSRVARNASLTEVAKVEKSVLAKIMKIVRVTPFELGAKSTLIPTFEAFESIPRLKRLCIETLEPLTRHQDVSSTFKVEQQLIFDLMGKLLPRLEFLSTRSNAVSLQYLAGFRDLRTLNFSGYSRSSPEETLEILRSLPKLENIGIQEHDNDGEPHEDSFHPKARIAGILSFTPDVLENIHSLRSFGVCSITKVPSVHLEVPIVKALSNHRKTLRNIDIYSYTTLSVDFVEELLVFIAPSRVKKLYIQARLPDIFDEKPIRSAFPETLVDVMIGAHGSCNKMLDPTTFIAPLWEVGSVCCSCGRAMRQEKLLETPPFGLGMTYVPTGLGYEQRARMKGLRRMIDGIHAKRRQAQALRGSSFTSGL